MVVKVQHPGIRQIAVQDMEAMDEEAGFLNRNTDTGRRWRIKERPGELRNVVLPFAAAFVGGTAQIWSISNDQGPSPGAA